MCSFGAAVFASSPALAPADEALWGKVAHYLGGEVRFRPPRVRDIAGYTGIAEPEVRRLFKLMGRMGKVDEVAHDHFFLRGTVAEIVRIMTEVAAAQPDGRFTAAQLRDQLAVRRTAHPEPSSQLVMTN